MPELRTIPSDNRILYFGRDREEFGFLSHFHPAPFELNGEVWPEAEHWYHAQKSFDPAYRQAIREAPTPARRSGWRRIPWRRASRRRNRGFGRLVPCPGRIGTK